MKEILLSLQQSVDDKNWYGALIIALTIPDICSKLENPKENTNKRYPKWFDKYINLNYKKHLSGNDCYALRCSYLHQGSHIIEGQPISEVISKFSFSPEGSHLCSFINIETGSKDDGKNICHLSVKSFCEDLISSSENWLTDIESNNDIQSRISEMLKINIVNKLYGSTILIK